MSSFPNEQALAARMRRFSEQLLEVWIEHGPDRECGGFHGELDRHWRPCGSGEKSLVQQARHLWAFSTWYERRERSERISSIAHGLYEFILARFSDPPGIGFIRKIGRQGQVTDPVHQVYPETFAVYALATYGRVFGNAAAIDRAFACFCQFDERVYDPDFGGYDLTGDPPWLTPGASKETNTYIHVVEALTALGEADPRPPIHQRLGELVSLITSHFLQPADYLPPEFLRDYRPLGQPVVSYGHDLETSWLLTDALQVLESKHIVAMPIASARERALCLGLASATQGFDSDRGGYFYRGVPGGCVTEFEKVWWVQFESLPALVQLHQANRLPDALRRLEKTLDWLEAMQVDAEFGGLYWGIMPDGSQGSHGDAKGGHWKASYHELRGLLYAADRLSTASA